MPDLNSVPLSPLSLAASRRGSSQPMPPLPSLNVLPSNQSVVSESQSRRQSQSQQGQGQTQVQPQVHGHGLSSYPSPSHSLPTQASTDSGVGPGPGPLRHPRPLTASELHMQLEKEQEAVVNRLTRELSLLRAAQNASVVSNTSSASAGASAHDPLPESSLLSGSGFGIPTSRRHHRNSSSASQMAPNQLGSSYESRFPISRPSQPVPVPLSHQDSSAISRRSHTNSPCPQASLDPSSYFHQQRVPSVSSIPWSSAVATPGSGVALEQLSPGLMPATSRYEETAFYRSELEAAKKENESLKRRIRDLERLVHTRRASDAARTRGETEGVTAAAAASPGSVPAESMGTVSNRDGPPSRRERGRGLTSQSVASVAGSIGIGVPEEEVKVGESAASSGLANKAP